MVQCSSVVYYSSRWRSGSRCGSVIYYSSRCRSGSSCSSTYLDTGTTETKQRLLVISMTTDSQFVNKVYQRLRHVTTQWLAAVLKCTDFGPTPGSVDLSKRLSLFQWCTTDTLLKSARVPIGDIN